MADESWLMMPEDVQALRGKVSANNNLRPLKDLCLANVADNLDFHCKDPNRESPWQFKRRKLDSAEPPRYHEPFKDLPAVLLSSLQRILENRRSAFSPLLLPCLVGANTTRLNANTSKFEDWDRERDDLIQRITDKGQNISELQLRLDKIGHIPNKVMHGLLSSLPRLTSLTLQDFEFDDQTLASIGSCYPHLRVLILLGKNCVFKKGLRYLYDSDLPRGSNGEEYGQCKRLTHLDVAACFVTTDGLVPLLSNLPDLVYLKSRYLFAAIAKFTETSDAPLKLQYLCLNKQSEKTKCLASVISKMPDVRKLVLCNKKLSRDDEFVTLEHVTDIKLINLECVHPSKATSLITNFSHQLTKLEFVFYDQEFDVSVVGFHCRQLSELIWRAKCTTESKYELLPSVHFNKLRDVQINTKGDCLYSIRFPDVAVKCILASPCLEKFLSCSYVVADGTLSWLVEEARAHGEVFSNLRELTLQFRVSSLRVKQILCCAPNLRKLKIPQVILRGNVGKFMRTHGLNHCQLFLANWATSYDDML